MPSFPSAPPIAASLFLAAGLVVLLWDVFMAGRVARLPSTPRPLALLSAFAGLLLAPAVIVQVASSSILSGRAVHAVSWVWPATLVLFALQAAAALALRRVSPLVGVPVLAYDVLLAVAAVSRYLVSVGVEPPVAALSLVGAQAAAAGRMLGPVALASAFALQLPLVAPAYPGRWRASRTVRAGLALAAAAWAGLWLANLPPAVRAVTSYGRYATEQVRERATPLALGLSLLPPLGDAPPSSLAVRYDLALADSTPVDAVLLRVRPSGVRAATLEPVARALEGLRADSVLLVVALGYDDGDGDRYRADPAAFMTARVRLVDQVARRLRPDYVIPADEPYGLGRAALGEVPVAYWQRLHERSADAAHRVSRRVRVGVSSAAFDAPDSTLFAWAAGARSPVDAAGFAFFPSFRGGLSLESRLAAADRWLRALGPAARPLWVWSAGGYPLLHGERSQERAIWRTVTWATTHDEVRGVVVAHAGDYELAIGLRAPGGRLRRAAGIIGRASAAVREGTEGRR